MISDSINREFETIRATEWWPLFMSELNRRCTAAQSRALSLTEPHDIYRAQGNYRALADLINLLNDPFVTASGAFTYGKTE